MEDMGKDPTPGRPRRVLLNYSFYGFLGRMLASIRYKYKGNSMRWSEL